MTRSSPARCRKRESVAHCHKDIKVVAQGLAHGTYEKLMGASNEVYLEWKKKHPGLNAKQLEDRFVAKFWGKHISAARATLTLMLRSPIDEKQKEAIVEILTLDATLMRGRREPATVLGEKKGS